MGTLTDQPPRKGHHISSADVEHFLNYLVDVSNNTGVDIGHVINLYHAMVLDRKNTLYVANGDVHDEQMAGIGEVLENMTEILMRLIHKEDL